MTGAVAEAGAPVTFSGQTILVFSVVVVISCGSVAFVSLFWLYFRTCGRCRRTSGRSCRFVLGLVLFCMFSDGGSFCPGLSGSYTLYYLSIDVSGAVAEAGAPVTSHFAC